jgi:hypothetical protein
MRPEANARGRATGYADGTHERMGGPRRPETTSPERTGNGSVVRGRFIHRRVGGLGRSSGRGGSPHWLGEPRGQAQAPVVP